MPRSRARDRDEDASSADVAVPRYYQIAAAMRARIERGDFRPNDAIPSERTLSGEFGVSRMTVRHAVQTLLEEGAVYRDPRRGTFVAEPRLEFPVGSFTEAILRSGRRPDAIVLRADETVPSDLVRRALRLTAGGRVVYVQRLRSADGEPIAIENSYLVADYCQGILDHDLTSSIWAVLREHFAIDVVRADAKIEAIALADNDAALLGCPPGRPAILLYRTVFDRLARPVEFARDIYRGDRAEFHIQEQDTSVIERPNDSSALSEDL